MQIGNGLIDCMREDIANVTGTDRAMFLVDDNVFSLIEDKIRIICDGQCLMELHAEESNKTIESVEKIWSTMLDAGLDRSTPLIAIGGGIVGDVGGFAAATYMRGVPLIQVPTTLLAMVDASIGGKTGVNARRVRSDGTEILGKNLVGAFWQPKLVVADEGMLKTLDSRQLRCGLAECVKHAMLGHPDLLSFIEEHIKDIHSCETDVMEELIYQSASIKAEIVSKDEREGDDRALLNLGHTIAHAMEPLPELGLLHGEAVAVGLVAAAYCAEAMGLVNADFVDRTREVLTKLGLPIRISHEVSVGDLIELMQIDKKNRNGRIRLVLPKGDSGAVIVEEVDDASIALGLQSVGATR